MIAGVLPSALPLVWLTIERDARHLIINGREELTGRTFRIELSRAAGQTVGTCLRSLAKTAARRPHDDGSEPVDEDVFEFGTNAKIEVA